jgi:putative FmdB family regulatory protein
MPTYDYQCGKCGFEFEREQRITEDAIKTCPKCKSRQAKRLLSAPNFILKGGGWYADGYGSRDSGSSSSDTSTPDSNASSESKTATAKDTPSSTDGDSGGKSSGGGKKAKKSAA